MFKTGYAIESNIIYGVFEECFYEKLLYWYIIYMLEKSLMYIEMLQWVQQFIYQSSAIRKQIAKMK